MEFESNIRPHRKRPRKKGQKVLPSLPKKVVLEDPDNFFQWSDESKEKSLNTSDMELNFKPLSRGLGFHHKRRSLNSGASLPRKMKGKELWEKPKYFSFEEAKKKKFQDTDLGSFYEPEHEEVFERIFHKPKLIKKSSVGLTRRLVAWNIDLAVVLSMVFVNIFALSLVSGIKVQSFFAGGEAFFLVGGLSLFWYMAYFSLFDYTFSTIGKKMMGLVLKSENKGRVLFVQTFIRSFFSLFSVLTFGLFSLLAGPSLVSKTQVYKNE